MPGNPPDVSLYSTAAQVIPVLFLALAFQARGGFFPSLLDEDWKRYRERREAGLVPPPTTDEMRTALQEAGHELPRSEAEMDRLFAVLKSEAETAAGKGRAAAGVISLLGILVLVAGEAVSLGVLEDQRPTAVRETIVGAALLVGGALVLFPLIRQQFERLEPLHQFFFTRRYAFTFATLGVMLTAALASYLVE